MTKQNEKDAKRVPELRFKGFADAWEQRKFSDIYKKSSEKNDLSFSKDKVISVADNKWGTTPKNSTDKYMRTYYVYRIGDIAFEGHTNKKFQYGRFVENTLANGIVSHIFDIYRPIQKEHDLWFWKYYIHNENIMRDVLRKSTTKATMMTNLVNKDLLKQKLNIPILEEQKKIGRLFSQIDRTITLHEEQHRQLEQLKKALLQKMFADETGYPALRFKRFSTAWEQHKLSKLTTKIGTGKSKYKLQDNGRYPILGSTSVIGYDNNFDYTGDFILTARVGANAGNLYRFSGSVKITDNTVFIKSKYNKFLYYYLQKYDLKKLSFGTGQPLVKASDLKNLKILKPRLDEEIYRISKLLLSVDNLITHHQHKIDNLKLLKRALLQKMFV